MKGLIVDSSGDIGDIAAGVLGVLSSIPGRHTLLLKDTVVGEHRTKGIVKRAHLVIPLVLAQPYIMDCRVWDGEKVAWHSCQFRQGFHSTHETLLAAHMGHALKVGITQNRFKGETPWLTANPDTSANGRVVIGRSPRYQNRMFKWEQVVKKYQKEIIFLGLPEEHRSFCQLFGEVEYRPVKDFLEAARLIAGSALFIGNQSAFMTVAEGLKVRRIQEACLNPSDCVYPGDTGAQYVFDGSMVLPGLNGEPETYVPSTAFSLDQLSLREIPPRGWLYEGQDKKVHVHSTPKHLARLVSKAYGISGERAYDEVIKQNIKRAPRHFARQINLAEFTNAITALSSAGITDHPVLRMAGGEINFDIKNP